MPHVEDFLLYCIAQRGDRYVFGTENSPLTPDPDNWDCSELFEWAAARAGVVPKLPDGAYYQWRHCVDAAQGMTVGDALYKRGALLFHGDGTGRGRDAITHVACSLGDATTIEARGSKYGVGTWAAPHRFQFAALIPGIDYTPRPAARQEDDVIEYRIVTIPPVNDRGQQWQGHDIDGKDLGPYRNDVLVDLKANDDGRPVKASVQASAFGGKVRLSFFGLDGGPAPQGNVGVLLNHPAR